jgi:hypothetical protein
MLREDGVRQRVFMGETPVTQGVADEDQLNQVADDRFRRAGRPIPVNVITWAGGANLNATRLAKARGDDDGLRRQDRDVAGDLGIRPSPRLTRVDPGLACRDVGVGDVGVLACDPRIGPTRPRGR